MLLHPIWKTIWQFLKKLKTELPYNPAVLPLGIYPKNMRNANSKRYMDFYVQINIIYNSQDMEATRGPINRQMDTCTIDYYSVIKKSEILPSAT